MRQAHARNEATRPAGQIVELAVLDAAAKRVARRRRQDGWLCAAMLALVGAFALTFGWYVLYPAMRTLIAP